MLLCPRCMQGIIVQEVRDNRDVLVCPSCEHEEPVPRKLQRVTDTYKAGS
jgi:DNA-directed RNA polymerase subunit M/transcription elongation factor TFIIS